jgi:GTP-binding protein YchF
MSFSVGIVGLPNVGKSTLFTALTKKQVDVANYPFCTIEPNVGVVAVPDERLDKLGEISKSDKIVNTAIEFVDIAGLVKNASQGEGLGNKFLAHIREVDAIVQVVREFKGDITHVYGRIDPVDDADIINTELVMADLQTITKKLEEIKKKTKGQLSPDDKLNLDTVTIIHEKLSQGLPVRQLEFNKEAKVIVKNLQLLTNKPLLYVYNTDEVNIATDNDDDLVLQPAIRICAKLEAELAGLPAEEVAQYLEMANIKQTGLDKLIVASYKMLNLITYITTGPMETKAWTVAKGTKAPQAAGVIHTDFEKNFIRAEIYNWQDLLVAGSEAVLKEHGKLQVVGKDYEMKDGDVCYFRIGA